MYLLMVKNDRNLEKSRNIKDPNEMHHTDLVSLNDAKNKKQRQRTPDNLSAQANTVD